MIRSSYAQLLKGPPLVTVIIPAYNEEKSILTTLLSISQNVTKLSVEIIVVNNNSTDDTEKLVLATGVKCINEREAGVRFARTRGLHESKGTYILNADADSIYPSTWIDQMIPPLIADNGIALTYGRYAFLPGEVASRFSFFLYENMADVLRWSKKTFKEEAMNVYGCNSGFRKEQCLAVNAYDHPPGSNEDGYLALKLREKGFGKLHYVPNNKALGLDCGQSICKRMGGLWKVYYEKGKRERLNRKYSATNYHVL